MTLTLITDSRPEDFSTKLERAFKNLLDRCMSNDAMTIAEQTAALKACMAYYESTQQKPGGDEGGFNGHGSVASKFSAARRGGASRDGGTIDQDADAF